MKKYVLLLLSAAGLLVQLPALGQGQPGTPPADYGAKDAGTLRGEGSYQLSDGSWQHSKKLVFDGEFLVLKNGGDNDIQLTPATVNEFEIAGDTLFLTSSLPDRPTPGQPELVESLFNRRGVRLLLLYASDNNQPLYFISTPQIPLQVLPSGRSEFKPAILDLVQGCPALVKKIVRGTLGRDRVLEILDEFVECQPPPPPADNQATNAE